MRCINAFSLKELFKLLRGLLGCNSIINQRASVYAQKASTIVNSGYCQYEKTPNDRERNFYFLYLSVLLVILSNMQIYIVHYKTISKTLHNAKPSKFLITLVPVI